jgi:5-methylcytosine-specific restriction endonuclease McrA
MIGEDKRKRQRMADARYREAHPERIAEACARWRAKNPKYQIGWNRRNPDKIRKIRARTYAKQETKDRLKKWREENPEKVAASLVRSNEKDPPRERIARRRAKKRANGGRLSVGLSALLLSEQDGMCTYCFADLEETGFHMDHYISIARGGPNEDSNIQLLCPSCNHRKSDRDPIEFLHSMWRI